MLNTVKRKITTWESRNKVYELRSIGEFFPTYEITIYSARKNVVKINSENYKTRYHLLKAYPNLKEFI